MGWQPVPCRMWSTTLKAENQIFFMRVDYRPQPHDRMLGIQQFPKSNDGFLTLHLGLANNIVLIDSTLHGRPLRHRLSREEITYFPGRCTIVKDPYQGSRITE